MSMGNAVPVVDLWDGRWGGPPIGSIFFFKKPFFSVQKAYISLCIFAINEDGTDKLFSAPSSLLFKIFGSATAPFPVVNCLRTPKCTRVLDFAYTVSNFLWGDTSGPPQAPQTPIYAYLATRQCSCFTERPQAVEPIDGRLPPAASRGKGIITLVERLKTLTATSEALVMSQAKPA